MFNLGFPWCLGGVGFCCSGPLGVLGLPSSEGSGSGLTEVCPWRFRSAYVEKARLCLNICDFSRYLKN